MRQRIIALLVLAGLVLVAPGTARAASQVRIYRIYFDSPGSDTGSNSSLNAEWIELKNKGSSAQNLKDWTVRDKAGHVYRFPSYSLAAGAKVHVHTGSGTNSGVHRFWRSGNYIWNNNGDKATLKKANGTTIDTCEYSGSGSSVYC